jgi:hypothetical protein
LNQRASPSQKKRWVSYVHQNRYHARQAAAALLKMAKTTSDPDVAAGLVQVAADLKDQAGELPPPVSNKSRDVQTEQSRRLYRRQ